MYVQPLQVSAAQEIVRYSNYISYGVSEDNETSKVFNDCEQSF
jgi:hypothetical protein